MRHHLVAIQQPEYSTGEESAKDHLQSKQLRDHHKPDEQEKGSPDPDLGAPVLQP
jgi:hypothetical protein